MKEIETYFYDFNNLVCVEKRKFWIYPKYSIFYFSRISLISQISCFHNSRYNYERKLVSQYFLIKYSTIINCQCQFDRWFSVSIRRINQHFELAISTTASDPSNLRRDRKSHRVQRFIRHDTHSKTQIETW